MESLIKMIFAGVMFGAWPLLMNRSGLSGNLSSFVMTLTVVVMTTPFVLYQGLPNTGVMWGMAITASLVAGFGILALNDVLSKVAPHEIGALLVVMTLLQAATPAIYAVYMNGRVDSIKAIGLAMAVVAAVLLSLPQSQSN